MPILPCRLGNLARKLFAHKRDPDDLTSSSSDEETAMKGWGAPSRPPRLSINPATMPPGVTLQARGSPRPSAYMRPSYVDSDETSSSDASSDPEVTSRRKIPIRKGALSPRATRPRAPPLAKMAKGAGERGGAGGHAEADSESSGRGVDISGEALDVVSEEVSEPDEGGGGPRERFWMRAKVQWWTDGMVPERPDRCE